MKQSWQRTERRNILKDICRLFDVEGIDRLKILQALDNTDFKDFEDWLQMQCARSFQADYIVSRNLEDFENSEIPCISPDEFCAKYIHEV